MNPDFVRTIFDLSVTGAPSATQHGFITTGAIIPVGTEQYTFLSSSGSILWLENGAATMTRSPCSCLALVLALVLAMPSSFVLPPRASDTQLRSRARAHSSVRMEAGMVTGGKMAMGQYEPTERRLGEHPNKDQFDH